jgi:hypothetical protein
MFHPQNPWVIKLLTTFPKIRKVGKWVL